MGYHHPFARYDPEAGADVTLDDGRPRRACAGRAATRTPGEGTLSGSVVVINTARFLGAVRSPWATT